jgi:recombination protein RecA
VIFQNQLRQKIGVTYGHPETTTGGIALKFYASVRLDIRRIGQIKESADNITGNRTKVKVVKNKMAPPFKVVEFDIMYGEGISKVGEIIDLGVELEIIKKSGSWFSYEGSKLGQGRDSVKQMLLDNPEICEELEAKIRARYTEDKAVVEKVMEDKGLQKPNFVDAD